MTSYDHRKEAGRQRRAAAARQGMTTRSYPPGAGRNRGVGPPQEPRQLTVAEALAELDEEDNRVGRQHHPRIG